MSNCARCGAVLHVYSTSFFNTDTCCLACLDDEKLAPGYAEAKRVELEQVQAKNYNFSGVGLSTADRNFLAERRALRSAT